MPLKTMVRLTSAMAVVGSIFLVGTEFKILGTLILFTAVLFWVYRLILRRAANYFQKHVLVLLENWYERQLKSVNRTKPIF